MFYHCHEISYFLHFLKKALGFFAFRSLIIAVKTSPPLTSFNPFSVQRSNAADMENLRKMSLYGSLSFILSRVKISS